MNPQNNSFRSLEYLLLSLSAVLGVAVIGINHIENYGIGIKSKKVEYPFSSEGRNMAVVKVERNFANPIYFVEGFDNQVPLIKGLSIDSVPENLQNFRIFGNYSNTINGVTIRIDGDSYAISTNSNIAAEAN